MRFQSTASTAVLTALIAPTLLASAAPVLNPTTVGKSAPAPPPHREASHISGAVSHRGESGIAARDLFDDFESLVVRALEDFALEERDPKGHSRPGEHGSGIPPRHDDAKPKPIPKPRGPTRPGENGAGIPPRHDDARPKPIPKPKRATGLGKKAAGAVAGRDFVDDFDSLVVRALEDLILDARDPKGSTSGAGIPPHLDPNVWVKKPTLKRAPHIADVLKKEEEEKKKKHNKKAAGVVAGRDLADDFESLVVRDFEDQGVLEARDPKGPAARPGDKGTGIPPHLDPNVWVKKPTLKRAPRITDVLKKEREKKHQKKVAGRGLDDEDFMLALRALEFLDELD